MNKLILLPVSSSDRGGRDDHFRNSLVGRVPPRLLMSTAFSSWVDEAQNTAREFTTMGRVVSPEAHKRVTLGCLLRIIARNFWGQPDALPQATDAVNP